MKVGIAGCAGRMGKELLLKAFAEQLAGRVKLIGGTVTSDSPALGLDLGVIAGMDDCGVKSTSDFAALAKASDVIIDFTNPETSIRHAKVCVELGKKFVCGTTGFSSSQLAELEELAKKTPTLVAPNMSLGVNLLRKVSSIMAKNLDDEWDVSVHESHHRHKLDAPSGTALLLGNAISEHNVHYSSIRAGDIVGEHTVMFATNGERVELTHKASNRSIFATGAFKAASWLNSQPAGKLYSMSDVLS